MTACGPAHIIRRELHKLVSDRFCGELSDNPAKQHAYGNAECHTKPEHNSAKLLAPFKTIALRRNSEVREQIDLLRQTGNL